MRKLLGLLVILVLVLGLRGIVLAASSVDGSGYARHQIPLVTGDGGSDLQSTSFDAQGRMKLCDKFGGVWDITIQKGTGAISGTYLSLGACPSTVTGQKTGKKLDLMATGLSSCQCNDWHHAVVRKVKGVKPPVWSGTMDYGGGTCAGSGPTMLSKCR